MQPEQQNQTPQPNSNIPDYLGMELVKDPSVSHKKKTKIVVILGFVLSILVLAGLATVAVLWWLGAPERQFYSMLDNAMQTKYIHSDINVVNEAKDENFRNTKTIQVIAKSDLSDPRQLKGQYSYIYDIDKEANGISVFEYKVMADAIVTVDDEYLTRFTGELIPNGLKADQWYLAPDEAIAGEYEVISRSAVNNNLNGLIVGNFNASQRQSLMQFIREKQIYVINNSHVEVQDEEEYTVFDVMYNPQRFEDLDSELREVLGIREAQLESTFKSNLEIWISNTTTLPTKVVNKLKLPKFNYTSTMISKYEYPNRVTITVPNNKEELPSIVAQ